MAKNPTCPIDRKNIVEIKANELLRFEIQNYVARKLEELNLVLEENQKQELPVALAEEHSVSIIGPVSLLPQRIY